MNLTLRPETAGQDAIRLRSPTMGYRVFDVLRQAIVQLQLRPGNALSEAEVAKQLGVSRQPVREAFIKLAEAGLVEIRPQRGTLVQLISRREVENARFLREAVEVAIARKAAQEAGPDGIAAMKETLARQREANERGDVAGFMRADDAFHQAIARSVECEHAWRVLEGLKVQMDRVRYLSMPQATPVPTLIAQHEAIVDAIAAHAPDEAEAAMRTHLSEILRSLPRIVEAHPEMFSG
jgi:GntR family transcriptional regulator, rspAB operon transcriptional repressor